ncbi:tRNA-dihydrouridine(16) synthase [Thalassocella blandensis]|nr:tRNA-dihydrouridine(16) synthase [Thalassocella blandensis]
MEGVVDHHMRYLLSKIGGIDLCVTEFVRVTDHVLPRKVFTRYCPEILLQRQGNNSRSAENLLSQSYRLSASESETEIASIREAFKDSQLLVGASCPTRIQLLGSNAEAIAENARKAAELGAPGIDLNFGCPAKTVNKNRGGACLLNEPDTLFNIVNAVRRRVPQHVPVTAKIRLGYEARNRYLENALAITEAGASELVVHARSKTDGYNPPAYWECIAEIKAITDITVIANGEVWTLQDYHRCRDVSQCDDVMIGRGLLATPDLALAIKSHQQGIDYQLKPFAEIAELLLEFFLLTSHAYPKKYMGNRVKQWLFYLQRQYPEAQQLFQQIKKHRDFTTLYSALASHCATEFRREIEQASA